MGNMQRDQSSRVLASLVSAFVALSVAPHVAAQPLTFEMHQVSETDDVFGVAIADMDRDGAMDILSTGMTGIFWYKNGGESPPSFIAQPVISTTGSQFIVVVDLDADGDLDVVASSAGSTWWYESDGGSLLTFTAHEIETSGNGGGPQCTVADIDRDGDLDIVTGGPVADRVNDLLTVSWYENIGGSPAVFVQHETEIPLDDSFTPSSVFVEDLDRDGDPDILYSSSQTELLGWLENDGECPPMFTNRPIPATLTNWHAVHAADLDCDGDADVVAGANIVADPGIWWFESDGASPPLFTESTLVSGDQLEEISCADLDRDGDIDVLGAQPQQGEMSWYESSGGAKPTFTKHVVFNDPSNGPRHVLAGDLDCDGDLDIVIATVPDGRVLWFENVMCDGDLDGDGVVGTPDILLLLGAWGSCP